MKHYEEHYEDQDRINTVDVDKQIKKEISKINKELINHNPNRDLVEKLAACRVHSFREDELNDLLTEIVKRLTPIIKKSS